MHYVFDALLHVSLNYSYIFPVTSLSFVLRQFCSNHEMVQICIYSSVCAHIFYCFLEYVLNQHIIYDLSTCMSYCLVPFMYLYRFIFVVQKMYSLQIDYGKIYYTSTVFISAFMLCVLSCCWFIHILFS